jgi:hypothetical protein
MHPLLRVLRSALNVEFRKTARVRSSGTRGSAGDGRAEQTEDRYLICLRVVARPPCRPSRESTFR